MEAAFVYELIGYLGSALVIVSIMQTSIFKLRGIGLIGSAVFLTYGLLIGAFPIVLVNLTVGSIHFYYLSRLIRKPSEVFNVLRVRQDSRLMAHFLEFHRDEIAAVRPGFTYEPSDELITSFILRDVVPAGLFVGRVHADNSVEILLDFVVPQYRDFKIGKYLYSADATLFYNPNLTQIWDEATDPEYVDYLTRMGFQHDPRPGVPDRYSLDLAPIIRPDAAVH